MVILIIYDKFIFHGNFSYYVVDFFLQSCLIGMKLCMNF